MQMDAETLTFLLRGGRLSMSERIERGLWPHPPLKLGELVRHLARVIESERWFPRPWQPAVPGKPVWEGGVIERVSPTKYIYRNQHHHPIQPTLLAGQTEKVFRSSKKAAAYYLKWDLNLPGDIDGWQVIK
jgi:hypothetical protein